MPLQHSGKLLMRLPRSHINALNMHGFQNMPMGGLSTRLLFRFKALDAHLFGTAKPAAEQHDWVSHEPASQPDQHPWDIAHTFARGDAPGSSALAALPNAYIEPDLLHTRAYVANARPGEPGAPGAAGQPKKAASTSLHTAFGPAQGVKFSPGWHLAPEFSNFINARQKTTGKGVRIAHLDTGCYPSHISTPRNLRQEQGYNYCDGNTNVIDPLAKLPWDNAGHGPATLALLAGNRMNMVFDDHWPAYDGDLGGAPDAEVLPVRISNSVVHLYTQNVAEGLLHALSPMGGYAPCDVVSLSHGGLPSQAWADAVNRLYDAGIIVVAASGDSVLEAGLHLATRYTVYPAAFWRVITATGVTYDHKPYETDKPGQLQGCWGPRQVMRKAVAAYTPNVPWIQCNKDPAAWDMTGGGTSASTPQVAAACALWLSKYRDRYPGLVGWKRVEACRHALFESVAARGQDIDNIGAGWLDADAMLSDAVDEKVRAAVQLAGQPGGINPEPEDQASHPFFRLLFGLPPPGSGIDEMFDTEAAQVVARSTTPELAKAFAEFDPKSPPDAATQTRLRDAFKAEPDLSNSLRGLISK